MLNKNHSKNVQIIEAQVQSRANDEIDLFEPMESLETIPSPRHYNSDELNEEVILPGAIRGGYINRQAKPNGRKHVVEFS